MTIIFCSPSHSVLSRRSDQKKYPKCPLSSSSPSHFAQPASTLDDGNWWWPWPPLLDAGRDYPNGTSLQERRCILRGPCCCCATWSMASMHTSLRCSAANACDSVGGSPDADGLVSLALPCSAKNAAIATTSPAPAASSRPPECRRCRSCCGERGLHADARTPQFPAAHPHKGFFACSRIHINPHMLGWVGV